MLGECRRLFANARNTANRVAKFNGLSAEPLYHPPRLASRLVGGPVRRLRAVGRPARIGEASGSDRVGDGLRGSSGPAAWSPGTARSERKSNGSPPTPASRIGSTSSARSTTIAWSSCTRRAGGRLPAIRRGFRLRDARGVPREEAVVITDRFRRPERVRPRRRQRLRLCARARARWPTPSTGLPPIAGVRRRWARPATSARRR